MKVWVGRALELLSASLATPKHELNELDWKANESPDKKRLSEHLSAMANYPGGGFLVFGVDNSGEPLGVGEQEIEGIVQRLANLGRSALEPPIAIDHAIEAFSEKRLLFIRIPESGVKPVHLRGKTLEHAFIRSGGTTRLAGRQEVGALMLHSCTPRWEELSASELKTGQEVASMLSSRPIMGLLGHPEITSEAELMDWLEGERFIKRESCGNAYITNLGAIAAARRLATFPELSRKAVRIVVYDGLNKAKTKQEQEGAQGYAVTFQRMMAFVMSLLPQSEVIRQALRQKTAVYPEIALREIIANALIHQDFTIQGASPLVEIFNDRVEVSNPGNLLPSKRLDRLIGTQPESRNEALARAFRRYKICEERGSGLLKAGFEVELYGLPPIKFEAGSNYFKVTLFTPRTYAQMSAQERLAACYQHAVLKHYSSSVMTNKTLRERLKMPEKQRSMVSLLIQEAQDQRLIKAADPDNKSKKFTGYIPIWA